MCCIVRLFWFTLLASNCFKGYCNRTYTLYCVDRVKSFLCIHLLHTPVRMNKTIPIWQRLLHSSCDLKCLFERRKKKNTSTRNRKKWKKLISHLFPSITNYNVYWQPEYTLCSLCIFSHQIQCITNAFGCRRAHMEPYYIFIVDGPKTIISPNNKLLAVLFEIEPKKFPFVRS